MEYENINERTKVAKVTLKEVNVIDISWLKTVKPGFWQNDPTVLTAIQAVDVILKAAALRSNVVSVSKKNLHNSVRTIFFFLIC